MTTTKNLTARTVSSLVKGTEHIGFRFSSYGDHVRIEDFGKTDAQKVALTAFLADNGLTVGADDMGYTTVSR
jgi:hypothetical protein